MKIITLILSLMALWCCSGCITIRGQGCYTTPSGATVCIGSDGQVVTISGELKRETGLAK